jgi:glycosyltransferase involved in cell wall biosynthesis
MEGLKSRILKETHCDTQANFSMENTQNDKLEKPTRKNTGFVSIVCACMNREDTLKVTLTSWLKFTEIGEIIIVDWSSKNSLEWVLDLDERVKLIRVNDQPYFNISKAYNLAIDNASKDYILKMDVDYLLNPYYNFFELHAKPETDYYTGDHTGSEGDPIFQHLNGLVYIKRNNLLAVNGYNENFEGYGWDDTELYSILTSKGKKRLHINHDYSTMHIVHPQAARTENYQNKRIRSSSLSNKRSFRGQKDQPRRTVKWSLNKQNERFFFAEISSI